MKRQDGERRRRIAGKRTVEEPDLVRVKAVPSADSQLLLKEGTQRGWNEHFHVLLFSPTELLLVLPLLLFRDRSTPVLDHLDVVVIP